MQVCKAWYAAAQQEHLWYEMHSRLHIFDSVRKISTHATNTSIRYQLYKNLFAGIPSKANFVSAYVNQPFRSSGRKT